MCIIYRYNINIPPADRKDITRMSATQFNLQDVPVANLKSLGSWDSTAQRLYSTNKYTIYTVYLLNQFEWFWVEEPLKGTIEDVWLVYLVRILWLQNDEWKRCIVLFQELHIGKQGIGLPSNCLLIVSDQVFPMTQADYDLVNIMYRWADMYWICIPSTKY